MVSPDLNESDISNLLFYPFLFMNVTGNCLRDGFKKKIGRAEGVEEEEE